MNKRALNISSDGIERMAEENTFLFCLKNKRRCLLAPRSTEKEIWHFPDSVSSAGMWQVFSIELGGNNDDAIRHWQEYANTKKLESMREEL